MAKIAAAVIGWYLNTDRVLYGSPQRYQRWERLYDRLAGA